MKFDPSKAREGLLSEDQAMLKWYLCRTVADTKAPLGNAAISDLQMLLRAWLTGLHYETRPILPRAIDSLVQAITGNEAFGESVSFHLMRLHWARAMAIWMSNGSQAVDDWRAALNFEKQDWTWNGRSWSDSKILRDRLDDFMAFAVQAGEYAQGIQTYERFAGIKALSLAKRLKPREYAYAVCLAQDRGLYEEAELLAAGRRMLQANLDENWLGIGQSLRAATWLKIV